MKAINKDPNDAQKPLPYPAPEAFQKDVLVSQVLNAVWFFGHWTPKSWPSRQLPWLPNKGLSKKTASVIVRKILAPQLIQPLANYSGPVALPTLQGGAEKLFEFKAFDFPDVVGTSVVSFGKKDSSYICLNGLRASQFGYREESVFWTFPTQVDGVATQKIAVSKLRSGDLVRLSRSSSGAKFLFDFYTR